MRQRRFTATFGTWNDGWLEINVGISATAMAKYIRYIPNIKDFVIYERFPFGGDIVIMERRHGEIKVNPYIVIPRPLMGLCK